MSNTSTEHEPAQADPWETAIEICRDQLADREQFDARERDFKLEVAERARNTLDLASDGRLTNLEGAIKKLLDPAATKLLGWRTAGDFRNWAGSDPAALARALDVLEGGGSIAQRIDRFTAVLPEAVTPQPGARLALASLFLFGRNPTSVPFYRPSPYDFVETRLGWPRKDTGSLGERYEHHLEFTQRFCARLQDAEVPVQDLLDAQGLIWVLAKYDDPEIRRWRGEDLDPEPGEAPAAVWWVNQGETYGASHAAGLLWAPLVDVGGKKQSHWERLTEARVGDLVLHYAQGGIKAVGTVTGEAVEAVRPEGLPDQGPHTQNGRRLNVAYAELDKPIPLTEIPHVWRRSSAGPFNSSGGVRQGYFFPVSPEFASQLAGQFPQLALPSNGVAQPPSVGYHAPAFETIVATILGSGLRFGDNVIRRYHLSLQTRGFVVLSGLSGSGKTQLARAYAQAVGATPLVVSVAPNWTTNEDLLGYVSPMTGEYCHTPFSEFLIKAADEHELAEREQHAPTPYHLILDEMNLARVEYYFAKFLSAMELRREGAPAPQVELNGDLKPALAPNLYFVGTVNIDETTHGFADKVYDRAQLIEIGVTRSDIEAHTEGKPYRDAVLDVWDCMHDVAPFAYRVLDDMDAYITQAAKLGVSWEVALDEQLLQKVLTKVKGTDPRVGEALAGFVDKTDEQFPLSHEKASAMLATFQAHGFVSYF